MGLTHFDDAPAVAPELGHLKGRWTLLGEAAGSVAIGLQRMQLPGDGWSTPAHEHGLEEEFVYAMAGSGWAWQDGRATPVSAGDGILFAPRGGAHTLCGGPDGLDLLVFGTRERDESPWFPRLERMLVGPRTVAAEPVTVNGLPEQWLAESELGPPDLTRAEERPGNVVALAELETVTVARARTERTRRNFGNALGSVHSGLQHVEVAPGRESTAPHCHSSVEEMFVVLEGDGVLVLADEETPVRAGSVVSRPAGTGVAHVFRAGEAGLTYLAYSNRDHADVCWYPRSRKIGVRGIGITFRVEPIEDYWDGEE